MAMLVAAPYASSSNSRHVVILAPKPSNHETVIFPFLEPERPMSTVYVKKDIFGHILENAALMHPREMLLLLRGKKSKDQITVTDLLVPPLAVHGRGFTGFQAHMLPIDFSLVGTVHSHPSGALEPSLADLHHSFGRIIMIVAFPYLSENNAAVFSHSKEKLVLKIID
jgi:proteasome lid subunit RPN8/RPN11